MLCRVIVYSCFVYMSPGLWTRLELFSTLCLRVFNKSSLYLLTDLVSWCWWMPGASTMVTWVMSHVPGQSVDSLLQLRRHSTRWLGWSRRNALRWTHNLRIVSISHSGEHTTSVLLASSFSFANAWQTTLLTLTINVQTSPNAIVMALTIHSLVFKRFPKRKV